MVDDNLVTCEKIGTSNYFFRLVVLAIKLYATEITRADTTNSFPSASLTTINNSITTLTQEKDNLNLQIESKSKELTELLKDRQDTVRELKLFTLPLTRY